jgi:3-oxoacyl-[acyl-carrier protein] reductase
MADLPESLLRDFIENRQLMKRQGRVSDLIGALRFFTSPASSFVTGETLVIGGGFPLRV